eukprot:CAMPEP_0204182344 /NCGR_PEP_ID=MMETSP0361-20130328/52684_1 /ASSEMBLY_ACC=CAM_ASM_000343 /TAXON_ID=268821 /ORGANISM="Scrippsiella Hangoei, Strain SHTV-5" /LENGTH=108 /DNA_ID=CAMNT_0051142067 /DNA_START=1 /DNA_END=324 /DNA_ORIENTATION=+
MEDIGSMLRRHFGGTAPDRQAAIDLLSKMRRTQELAAVFASMQEFGVEADLYMAAAAVTACRKCSDWVTALCLLGNLAAVDVEVSPRTYTVAVDACGRTGAWPRVVWL